MKVAPKLGETQFYPDGGMELGKEQATCLIDNGVKYDNKAEYDK